MNDTETGYFDDLVIEAVHDVWFSEKTVHAPTLALPGHYSIELIASGEVLLKLDGIPLHLKAPVLFWIGDSIKKFLFCHVNRKEPYRHLWIDFMGERGKRIYHALLKTFPAGCLPLSADMTPAAVSVFERFNSIFRHSAGYDGGEAVLEMERLVYMMLKTEGKLPVHPGDPFHLEDFREKFRHAPFQPFDIRTTASEKGISVIYLRKLFKQRFGMSIGRFVRETRMLTAKELLESGQYRISELSDMCGYSNLPAFSNAFRSFYGISPRAERKRQMRKT